MKRYVFEILDEKLNFIKNINPLSCSFDYDSLSALKASCNAIIKNDDFFYNDKNFRIKEVFGDNINTIATLLISTSTKNMHDKTCNLVGYDRCIILQQDKLTDSIVIPAYTNIIRFISVMLVDYENSFRLIENNSTNKADIFFEIGTSKLEVINYLLNMINYSSLLTDKEGCFYAQKYVLPSDRNVEITYTDDRITSTVYKNVVKELDLFNVPNVFVRVTNNASINPPIKVVYENNNPDSILSTNTRGRRIVDFRKIDNVTDRDTLFAIVKREAYQSSDVYEHLDIQTAINTKHWYLNMIGLNLKTYNIDANYIETNWSISNFKVGGVMRHRLRRVINV